MTRGNMSMTSRGNMATLTLCAVHETICCLCTLLIPFVGNITITPSLLPPNLPKPLYIRKKVNTSKTLVYKEDVKY